MSRTARVGAPDRCDTESAGLALLFGACRGVLKPLRLTLRAQRFLFFLERFGFLFELGQPHALGVGLDDLFLLGRRVADCLLLGLGLLLDLLLRALSVLLGLLHSIDCLLLGLFLSLLGGRYAGADLVVGPLASERRLSAETSGALVFVRGLLQPLGRRQKLLVAQSSPCERAHGCVDSVDGDPDRRVVGQAARRQVDRHPHER